MRTTAILTSILTAGLLTACGSTSAGEAPGLVGSVAPEATTSSAAPVPETTSAGPTPTPSVTKTVPPTPTPTPTKKAVVVAPAPTKTKAAAKTDPDMGTCKAAKAAGYGPYYEGKDPEYDYYQDRDHDGIVCE